MFHPHKSDFFLPDINSLCVSNHTYIEVRITSQAFSLLCLDWNFQASSYKKNTVKFTFFNSYFELLEVLKL
jgi:hypothetical protein